ncbi:MAG TPA: ABC transporter ATP-binding protein [Acidocella sp.]|nr:ABC transporter ATP-binding protein [Acidocella sp.]
MSQAGGQIAIDARAVTRHFGGLAAVSEVSLSIKRGEIFGLVGPDGAGKTTLMRMLAGLLRPDAGAVTLDGVDVLADPEAAKSRLSYMPQRFGLYEDLTVDENIFFYAELFGVARKARQARAAELLEAAGMAPFRRRLAGKLSGGMKQKLGLVCALIHTPAVLLLDEPTTGVDPVSRRDFWGILYNLRESGVTILFSTAYMDEAERCSRLALMHAGRVHDCDTPARLKRNMPGALLAIAAPDPRAIRAALAGAPGVLGMLLKGDHVNLRADSAGRMAEFAGRLRAQGVAYSGIAQVEPGIEDVFVALTGDDGSAA